MMIPTNILWSETSDQRRIFGSETWDNGYITGDQQPSRYNPIKRVIAWELTGPMWVVRSMLLQRTCCFWLKVVFLGVTNGVEETNCVLSETIATLDDMFCSMETSNYRPFILMLYSSDLNKHLGTCCWLLVGRRFDALQTSSCKVLRGDSTRFPEISFLRFDFDMPLDIARIWLALQQCMLDPIDSRPGCAIERPEQQMSKSGVWWCFVLDIMDMFRSLQFPHLHRWPGPQV